jgi:hypothetical protein
MLNCEIGSHCHNLSVVWISIDDFLNLYQTIEKLFWWELDFLLKLCQGYGANLRTIKTRSHHFSHRLLCFGFNFIVVVSHFLNNLSNNELKVIDSFIGPSHCVSFWVYSEHFIEDLKWAERYLKIDLRNWVFDCYN